MFERYTESARRALFFARYESAQRGAIAIETEHVLLGLARESKGLLGRILAQAHLSLEGLRTEIEARSVFVAKISTSVAIPFSAETVRVLKAAAEEADGLTHNYIGTEHLLLGLLREEGSVAGTVLTTHGLRLNDVRNTLVKLLAEPPAPLASPTRAAVSEQIDHIKQLVERLATMPPDTAEARTLADQIGVSLDGLKRHLAD